MTTLNKVIVLNEREVVNALVKARLLEEVFEDAVLVDVTYDGYTNEFEFAVEVEVEVLEGKTCNYTDCTCENNGEYENYVEYLLKEIYEKQ